MIAATGAVCLIILALLLVSAVFSAAETALTRASRGRMHQLEREGDRAARRVNHLLDDQETMIGAVLIGYNVLNILSSALATEFITNQHLLRRDVDWTASYFKTGVWGTERTGITSAGVAGTSFTQWDQAASDPIGDVAKYFIEFRRLTGFAPNIAVLGPHVMNALKQHPDIIDRIKYTQRGIVSEDLIATLFDVDELYVSYASISSGPQINDAVTQDAAATYAFIGDPTAVLFAYAPSSPSLMTPSAGYMFMWKGYLGGNAKGVRVKRFRMEHIASDRIEAEQTYDMHVVAADMGLFLGGAVAAVATGG